MVYEEKPIEYDDGYSGRYGVTDTAHLAALKERTSISHEKQR